MWCVPRGRARGLGDLVGLMGGIGLGLGVLAKGLRGMCPTDFRLEGDCRVLVFTPNLCLCFNPCKDEGLVVVEPVNEAAVVTGEHGAESAGLDESDCGSGVLVECLICR